MDKRVIFAVAGSGKTTFLIKQLNEVDRFLIITYTLNNVQNLRMGIIKTFGFFPDNIKLLSYYTFLYGICYKPLLHDKLGTQGINFLPNLNRFAKKNTREYYIDKYDRLYSARISKLLIEKKITQDVTDRIAKYFDYLMIDEIQDFGGNDFNLLKHISKAPVNIKYVGDFYQHTFDTGRDGNTNATLHDDFNKYIKEFEKMGLIPDTTTLSKSYRCSPSLCAFISENLDIPIESHKKEETKVEFIERVERAQEILRDSNIVKLFYKEHYKYNCYSMNWGGSKGDDRYNDVCVVLNETTLKYYSKGNLKGLPPATKNKLYVALSRTKNNLYIVPHTLLK